MPINIHNSLTRKKEEFIPLEAPQVNIYTCGVTVYDDCHIGHARSLYIFDVIRKYLKYRGYNVKFVRNITDIDDKIINRANELKTGWQELVNKYITRYYEDLAALGVDKADVEPRATENIKAMISHISGLIELGFAYQAGGDVYFDVRKFSGYGKLSGQSIDQMEAGSRIDPSDLKKDHLDFALWKNSKPGEPSWDSPWGKGRPGWHIECSVMSAKYLQVDTLDIHAGGRDLIFPHHENEIAQAEALSNKPFAKYWIHHGLLTINSQKMSKSLGNFVTIKDFIEKYKNADLLKLFFLTAHYSHPIDYTEEKIEEAKKALERLEILLLKIQRIVRDPNNPGINAFLAKAPFIEEHKNNFIESMDDDFNTPRALGSIFDLVADTNKFLDSTTNQSERVTIIHQASETIFELTNQIFGLSIGSWEPLADQKNIMAKINERNRLKNEKKYAEADAVRKELESQGIILEDTKTGTTWRRKL